MDRRLTAFNGRVADLSLAGQVTAERFVQGVRQTVMAPVADLLSAPDGPRDRQVQRGAIVACYETLDGWSFVQSERDGYVGYMQPTVLGALVVPTHFVATPATHAYQSADMKSPDVMRLGLGARVRVEVEAHKFYETDAGFVPKAHLRPVDRPFSDPATVAQAHFGVPYLWGGNSTLGIDCSGLVQAALWACEVDCPGDSDMQEAALGNAVPLDAPAQRGDLYFWKGHVAMAVDADTLIHANAHHMAVAYEPIAAAIARIAAQGDGPVTSRKRLG